MRKFVFLTIFLVIAVMIMGCTQSATTPAATQPSATAQAQTQAQTQAPVATQANTQPSSQGDAAKYLETSQMILSEVNQAIQLMNSASTKLDAISTPDQLQGALASVSSDLNSAKLHVQTAEGHAQDLTRYATTPQQQQDAQKIQTYLVYLENAIASMNDAIGEAQKPSPNIALMDSKIKEMNGWLAKIV